MSDRNQRLTILMVTLCVALYVTSSRFDWELLVIIAMFLTGAGVEYKRELTDFIKHVGGSK